MSGGAYFNISIETEGPVADEEQLETLIEVLGDLGAPGAAVGAGGVPGGTSATFTLDAPDHGADSLERVCAAAIDLFTAATEKAGLPPSTISHMDVMAAPYFERWLETPPDELAGVAELAELFGVSRQRMSELRMRKDFPAPLAELAAGPVWKVANLRRFLDSWERKPGRPHKAHPGEEGRAAKDD